ncbi:MAG: hypothetical protein A2X36_09505 [Elusimicrobia bacterium GWA2_69_24]|nr:MAG: hypothetical protein A2X36_09505 [Elusimicrobia bacterium GWA2_69_24]HBL15599.1 hypothetical protein [Elusimicrobiota bacterium]
MKNSAAALILAILPACAAAQTGSREEFDAAAVKSVEVRTVAGDISLETSPAPKASVEVSENDPQKCAVTVELKGGRLLAEAKNLKKLSWGDSSCRAAFRVRAPTAAKLTAISVSGKVAAAGFSGDVTLESVSGNVKAAGVSRSLRLKTVSGNAALSRLAGPLDAETVSGGINAAWTAPPGKEGVRVQTVSGDAELAFTAMTALAAVESKTLGSVSNEFPADPAGAPVRFKSVSGDLRIKKAPR